MPNNHLEKNLWDADDELRANSKLRAADYSIPVLGLIFLKYADHKFAHATEQFQAQAEKSQRRRRTEAEKLRGTINAKLQRLIRRNRSRVNYQQEFQRLIDAYNAGSSNTEAFFDQLVDLAQRLNEEEQRHIREELTEEQLAIFDILTRPDMHLTAKQERRVKKIARDLLTTLSTEKLILDWRKRQQSRAAVRLAIEDILYDHLPDPYTPELCTQKRDDIYQHIYDNYTGAGQSIYTAA